MHKFVTVTGLGLVLAVGLSVRQPASGAVGGGGSGSSTSTTSTTQHTSIFDSPPVTLNTQGYSTQVLGIFSNSGSNTTVFNVTVDSGVDLNGLNQRFAEARRAVEAAHAQSGNRSLDVGAARLRTSTPPVTTTTTATNQTTSTETTVTSQTTLGPGTILVGPDLSESFFVAAGSTNININTHTETFILRELTTTNQAVKSSVYEVVGVSTP